MNKIIQCHCVTGKESNVTKQVTLHRDYRRTSFVVVYVLRNSRNLKSGLNFCSDSNEVDIYEQ